jgi:branched-chain amino acid transport system substrate-binding protein
VIDTERTCRNNPPMRATTSAMIAAILLGTGFSIAVRVAAAAEMSIGLAVPLSGKDAMLGEQLQAGVETAAANHAGATVTLETADSGCTADGGAKAARQFVDARVGAVVGFLCTEAIEAALPILKEANIPVITPGVRANSLTDKRYKTGWPVYRLAPRDDEESKAVAAILTKKWADKLFAIIDDGTIYGRELSENFRLATEQAGLKPVFTDNYRPQMDNQIGLVGRLKKAGAEYVFAGGDRTDIAVIGREAPNLGLKLTIAGGEALRAEPGDVPLARGTLMIGLPDWSVSDDRTAFFQLAADDIAPEGYVLPGYAALQIAASALAQQDAQKNFRKRMETTSFDTAIGPIRFDDKGDVVGNPYRLYEWDGNSFVEVR